MAEQSLLHVTLNTNQRRRILRSEVSHEGMDLLSALILKPTFAIPGQAAYRCDVFDLGDHCPCFQVLDADWFYLVTFGVGFGGDCSQALWTALHRRTAFRNLTIKTQLESSFPQTPCIGVLLESGPPEGFPAMAWLVLDRAESRAGGHGT